MNELRGDLERLIQGRRESGRKTVVPFLTAGYPDPETFDALLAAVAGAGCPLVEIGVPFSDPIADGPVIQAASQQALQAGVTVPGVLEMAARAHGEHGLQVVLMGYLNPMLHFGPERFAAACAQAGVGGLIVPDLPREEAGGLRPLLDGAGVTLIDLVAPTTDELRLQVFGRESRGFLYLVSTTGVTGSGRSGDLAAYVERVRAVCPQPLYVGFGISSPEDAAQVGGLADGVIIGSALLRLVTAAGDRRAAVADLERFLQKANLLLNPTGGGERS